GVDGKIVQSSVKLRDYPIQAMPIDVNGLADANLQRTFRPVVLGAEIEAPATAQHADQLLEHRDRLANMLERFVEDDEIDAFGGDHWVEVVQIEVDDGRIEADGTHVLDAGSR